MQLVQEALEKVQTERTCLVIAHRLSTIKNVPKILVLSEGCVAEEGTYISAVLADLGIHKYGIFEN